MMLQLIWAILAVELLVVGIIDIKTRKISNYWTYAHMVLVPLIYFLLSPVYLFSLTPFLYALGALGFGFLLFQLGIMGGGDAKFLPTFFLLIPTSWLTLFVDYLLFMTLLFAGIIFLMNLFANLDKLILFIRLKDRFLLKGIFGKKIPYAPTFFLAWIGIGWELFLK